MVERNSSGMSSNGLALSRRDLLRTVAAGAAALALPIGAMKAQAKRGRIDVHHHMLPAFIDLWSARKWSPQVSIEAMDKFGTETSILSVTGLTPSYADLFYDGSEKARAFVRRMNDYGAKVASDNPKRFGFFAVLPMPDQDACLKEIAYAFDTLKADGIVMFTDTGDKWPGDPMFRPVYEELNRRKASVFFHPSVPKCCRGLMPGTGDTTLEFDFDTTRAVTSLLNNGVLAQMPDIRFIINHAGAALPALSGRIKDQVRNKQGAMIPGGSAGALEELRKLYFEVAHATFAPPLAAMMKLAPSTQYLWGTDFPVWPYETTVGPFYETTLPVDVAYALDRGNAARLFPKFA
jgi:predicted TIM-barrel fold metal-dependent hydrolase